MTPRALQASCFEFLCRRAPTDAAHDLAHVKRVVKNTLYLTDLESANSEITLPAACLHDCVSLPKDDPRRSEGSRLAAAEASDFLAGIDYPAGLIPEVAHAIEAHSFSAGIPCRTLEARIVQDADRLDALGAIGIARCLLTGGALGSDIYHADDPFAGARDLDDKAYMVDHFYAKLFKLPATMVTEAGRAEAERRVRMMEAFLAELGREAELYPYSYDRTHTTEQAADAYHPDAKATVRVAGRLISRRGHGKTTFGHLRDGSGRVQVYFRRDDVVPPGHLWMMGATADSFDSRYWGFLPEQRVIGRAYALW